MKKTNIGLTKNEYVKRYMEKFTKFMLFGDQKRHITDREEKLLECERMTCLLFFEQFYRLHKRTPDVNILDEEVKRNFISRAHVYAGKTEDIAQQEFINLHLRKVKSLYVMKEENYSPEKYNYILERERTCAKEYFINHDNYPSGYEMLKISKSKDIVEQGLNVLLKAFYENYRYEYRRYEKRAYYER